MPRMIIKISVISIITILSLFILTRLIVTSNNKKQYKISSNNGIEELESIDIDGMKQWILIRGEEKTNPIVLYLKGGPGMPMFSDVRELENVTGIESKFTVVYWEQRGTGKSSNKNITSNDMTIPDFVNDINEITKYLKTKFDRDKIFLMGHSWGSDIGLTAASKFPDDYYGYIGITQDTNPLQSDIISYEKLLLVAHEIDNKHAIEELLSIGKPPYNDFSDNYIRLKWLKELVGYTLQEESYNFSTFSTVYRIFSTPEYSNIDFLKFIFNPLHAYNLVDPSEYMNLDFFSTIKEIDTPVYFIVGKHDIANPSSLTIKYYNSLIANKGKEIYIFDGSRHMPQYEEPEKFIHIIEEIIKKTHTKDSL